MGLIMRYPGTKATFHAGKVILLSLFAVLLWTRQAGLDEALAHGPARPDVALASGRARKSNLGRLLLQAPAQILLHEASSRAIVSPTDRQ